MRLDKWLWAARFFKSRVLARTAVTGGHVRLNDERPKPARELRPGDRLSIQEGGLAWEVTVLALSDRRGPVATARQLYAESEESRRRREERWRQRQLGTELATALQGRPTKRDRRLIHRFTESG